MGVPPPPGLPSILSMKLFSQWWTNLQVPFHFQHAWPRTPTERLLADLQGTAAKFLAILEALSETHRRTLHCEAPAPDAEDTAIDVCAELFFAGMDIIAGGGGIKQAVKHDGVIHPSVWELQSTSVMELVAKGRFEILSSSSSLSVSFFPRFPLFRHLINLLSFFHVHPPPSSLPSSSSSSSSSSSTCTCTSSLSFLLLLLLLHHHHTCTCHFFHDHHVIVIQSCTVL